MEKNDLILISSTILFLLLVFIMLIKAPAYTGKVIEINNLDDALNNLDELKDGYNTKADGLPGFISRIFGNEVMRIEIMRRNGSVEEIDLKTVAGKAVKVDDVNESCTMEINTNEDTFDKILSSENQLDAFRKSLDKKEISYKALKFKTKLKVGTIRTILRVRSWFW